MSIRTAPLAPNSPCMVRVVVSERGEVIHDKMGDYNERYFREWIDKTQWWAMRHGKTMAMSPK